MTSIQEYCASTGRTLEASPPMAVAGQPLTWVDSPPWQRIESPEPSAVIYVDPGAHRDPVPCGETHEQIAHGET